MKQIISWLIRNRKTVIAVGGLAIEYVPKAYRWTKEKFKKNKNGKSRN